MISLESLARRIDAIEIRNRRVELDKLWETSLTRRVAIAIFTFLSIGTYMRFINIDQPWLNAIVPTIGFTLSTFSLPWLKIIWKKIHHWFEEKDILEAIKSGEKEERTGKLKPLSKDLRELLDQDVVN